MHCGPYLYQKEVVRNEGAIYGSIRTRDAASTADIYAGCERSRSSHAIRLLTTINTDSINERKKIGWADLKYILIVNFRIEYPWKSY